MAGQFEYRQAEAFFPSLPKNTLLLHRFYGKEQISSPFEFHLDLLSANPAINFDLVLGAPAAVRLELPSRHTDKSFFRRNKADQSGREDYRWFNGLIRAFSHVPSEDNDRPNFYRYRAVMSPSLWFLSLHTDCRIFQNETVPSIVKQLLEESGIQYRVKLFSSHYQPREYCVQYNESTFNFISRLLEHEGIHYYFAHDEKTHKIVLADGDLVHTPVKGYKNIIFDSHTHVFKERMWSWMRSRTMQPDRVSLKDFNFKIPQQCTNPRNSLLAVKPLPRPDKGTDLEIFEYPGRYDQLSLGEAYARIRAEEYRTRYETYTGKTNACGVTPGSVFTLMEHPDNSLNREYLITSCDYKIEIPGLQVDPPKPLLKSLHRKDADQDPRHKIFSCMFNAIPVEESVRFQPARTTTKPFVRGPQTAVVTTSDDSKEIETDKYGRVKVHFFWDRHNPENDTSSCWLRVSMPWAGKGWGGVQIPRKGQEVIVDFLEGDPDQPIITGRVYNAATMPPLSGAGRPGSPPSPASMEQAAQQMSLRSNSLGQNGSAAKGNEITMNDDEGGETMFVNAEKDETHNVNNDRLDTVGNNEVRSVGVDRTRTVGSNETVTVGNNEIRTVGNNRIRAVGANESVTIGASRQKTVGSNEVETIGANQTSTVGANRTLLVGANNSETVGATEARSVGSTQTQTIGTLRTTSVGLVDQTSAGLIENISAGIMVAIAAGITVQLKGPGGSIAITPDGISIKGKKITIEGDTVHINP